jgi:hemerythrin-like domain-containing protein
MSKKCVFLGCLFFVSGFLLAGIPEVWAQLASESVPSGILPQAGNGHTVPPFVRDLEESNTEECQIRVTPVEDLNGEHGVVDRILLIFDEIVRRMEKKEPLPPEAISKTVEIVRSFIQNHHEKLEDTYMFPRFRQAGKYVDLITIMTRQHEAGRKVTDEIVRLEKRQNSGEKEKMANAIRAFARMYRAHKSREDTVILPAFHALVPSPEYEELGDEFERQEETLFGKGGFGKILRQVEALEKSLGIYELAQFTPDTF